MMLQVGVLDKRILDLEIMFVYAADHPGCILRISHLSQDSDVVEISGPSDVDLRNSDLTY